MNTIVTAQKDLQWVNKENAQKYLTAKNLMLNHNKLHVSEK